MSVVHESPSLHVEAVAHVPEPLHMPQPAALESSQRSPVRAVQLVVLAAVSHRWQNCDGLTVLCA